MVITVAVREYILTGHCFDLFVSLLEIES
uniref:Uncharacterized protein n=1 Tax=Rhizophora mucronata TaxID=61149 RepID=A0A2P2LAD3_RHIMU